VADLATLARPYANAAFGVARDNAQLPEWARSLGLMAAASSDSKLQTVIGSPSVDSIRKAEIVSGLCGDDITDVLRQFVRVLAENKRLALLPSIFIQFETLRAQEEKSLDVEVVSAFEMNDEELQNITNALRKRFDRDIRLESAVDASLLGGAIVRAGDTVIDGSVRGKMKKMTETLQRV
jgi:F-type H+-transporting ATPase subunit delta